MNEPTVRQNISQDAHGKDIIIHALNLTLGGTIISYLSSCDSGFLKRFILLLLKIYLFLFYEYEYLPACMYVHHMYTVPTEATIGTRSPGTGVTEAYEPPCGARNRTRVH